MLGDLVNSSIDSSVCLIFTLTMKWHLFEFFYIIIISTQRPCWNDLPDVLACQVEVQHMVQGKTIEKVSKKHIND